MEKTGWKRSSGNETKEKWKARREAKGEAKGEEKAKGLENRKIRNKRAKGQRISPNDRNCTHTQMRSDSSMGFYILISQ